jgi:hypothetical protein
MKGPFPALVSDITIFRGSPVEQDEEDRWDKSSLYLIQSTWNGTKGLANDGYKGEPDTLLTWEEGQSKELREFFQMRGKNREGSLYSRRFKSWSEHS